MNTPNDTPASLDEIASNYSEERGFERTLIRYKLREVMRFAYGKSGLDIGCGVGYLCRALAGQLQRVVGLDGSRAKIGRALQLNACPGIEYVNDLFETWSTSERFDTITATNVAEHVEDVGGFMARCYQLLNSGGRLIVTVPNALGLHKRIGMAAGLLDDYYRLTDADRQKGHRRIYDRAMLERDIESPGLRVVHSGGILLKVLSSGQMESWDAKIVDALYEIGKELPDYCSSLIVVGERT